MKPQLFIGSSAEAVFGLGQDLRRSFNQQLDTSAFAAFVFAPDDKLTIRGEALLRQHPGGRPFEPQP